MKKKMTGILMLLSLSLSMLIPSFAAGTDGFSGNSERVIDQADLLSDSEEEALCDKLDEISLRQSMDVAVVTTDTLNGYLVEDYADTYYEQCDFGYGEDKDGLLLLISMEARDYYITTSGFGITAFTDAGIQYLGEQITSDLSEEDYAAAFDTYAELCDDFITQAKTGKPYDNGTLPKAPLPMFWIPVSLIIGIVLAKVIVGGMKSELKTVRRQAAAKNYVRNGSLNLTENRDLFLYHTVTRMEKPKKDTSSGSTTHSSSSGKTHGGGGGKF